MAIVAMAAEKDTTPVPSTPTSRATITVDKKPARLVAMAARPLMIELCARDFAMGILEI